MIGDWGGDRRSVMGIEDWDQGLKLDIGIGIEDWDREWGLRLGVGDLN